MREDYNEIFERMKEQYRDYAGYTPDDASDIGIRMRTLAGEIFSLECSMEFIKRQMFPTTATGKYLDMHAEMRGISRKGATRATGRLMFYVQRSLPYDFTIPEGTVCTVRDGSLRFITDTDVILPANNIFITVAAHAEYGGSEYNIPINTVNSIVTYFSESIRVNNSTSFIRGADAEEDDELRKRIAESYYTPSNGINETFYKQLAMSVDGVYSASVWRLAHGTGTVGVFIASQGTTASADAVSEVQLLMDKVRPVNVTMVVSSAELESIPVKVAITVSDGYYSNDVITDVKIAIQERFKRMGVGESFRLCDLGETIYHVKGVESYTFDTSVTEDKDGDYKILYKLGTLDVTA